VQAHADFHELIGAALRTAHRNLPCPQGYGVVPT
jgi:hypothetical protein